ncbi:hypothetical protein KW798_01760 [Candidatus Parcubacteria bacterium]|nr:hypothetical protein [Candidatus Parcubacteria bacterium]
MPNYKKSSWYRELWFAYYRIIVFRRGGYWHYLVNKFFIKPKIRHVTHRLDNPVGDFTYTIHLLCSHRDLDMLLWSLGSWYQVVPQSGKVYIHEDGSFTHADRKLVERLLPHAEVVDFDWASERLSLWLKAAPSALQLRRDHKKHILIVKLIDPQFTDENSTTLILDTDILWFKEPKELLVALHMQKTTFQYGGPTNEESTKFKDGTSLREDLRLLNSGIIAYPRSHFLLKDLEAYASSVIQDSAPHFIEQSGYAWILARGGSVDVLPKETYIIKPSVTESTIAKHYTGPRREEFWLEGVALLKDKIL